MAERGVNDMRKLIAGMVMLAVLVCVFMPGVSFTEDRDTVLLAKTIYALGRNESYETKLALGNVVTAWPIPGSRAIWAMCLRISSSSPPAAAMTRKA